MTGRKKKADTIAAAAPAVSQPIAESRKRLPNTKWNDADDEELLSVLEEAKDEGKMADNSFKKDVWEKAAIRVEALRNTVHGGGPKTADSCKTRCSTVSVAVLVQFGNNVDESYHSLS